MEGSASHEEERRASFYAYHPCYFLEQAFRALLRCLGFESPTKTCSHTKQEKTKPPSGPDPIIDSPSNNTQICSQDAADPPSTTNQSVIGSSAARRGSRRSEISQGSGPRHN